MTLSDRFTHQVQARVHGPMRAVAIACMAFACMALAACAPKTPPVSAVSDKPDLSARLDAIEAAQHAIKARQDAQESAMLAMQEHMAVLDSRLDMIEYALHVGKGASSQLRPPAKKPVPHMPTPHVVPSAKKASPKPASVRPEKMTVAPSPVVKKPVAEQAAKSPAPKAPPAMSKQEQASMHKAFDAAMRRLKSGDYEQATSALTSFLHQYPHGEQAPEARYWLGEALFAQMQVAKAVDALKAFESMPVTAPKRAPALFRLGAGYQRMGAKQDAARVYATLRRDYPGSIEANNAARQMKRLGVIAPPLAPPAAAQKASAAKPDQAHWAVNIVSLDVRHEAKQMLAKLRKQGLHAEMMKVKVAGKFWYRLRIPGYDGRAAAESARLKIVGRGYADAWVSPE